MPDPYVILVPFLAHIVAVNLISFLTRHAKGAEDDYAKAVYDLVDANRRYRAISAMGGLCQIWFAGLLAGLQALA
jgi:hypothetical protein